MAKYKFADTVITSDGKKGTVQEDQTDDSYDVKVQLEGDDYSHIFKEEELQPDQSGL